jgi:3-oxoacid CoA-transferase subunit B
MMHTNPKGASKLLPECSLPLTGVRCVQKIVTDLAVLEVSVTGFKLLERAPGVTVEEILQKTAGNLIVEGEVPEMTGVE